MHELGQKTYMTRLSKAKITSFCRKHEQRRLVIGTEGGGSALDGGKEILNSLLVQAASNFRSWVM